MEYKTKEQRRNKAQISTSYNGWIIYFSMIAETYDALEAEVSYHLRRRLFLEAQVSTAEQVLANLSCLFK